MDSDDSKVGFFKHVFNFDDESKADILNIVQYSLIAIIPVVILNKTMSRYIPEADEKKGSLEVSAEIIIQIIVMFIGLLIIHRIITFIPTFSETKYPDFNIIFIILAVLMITLSLQTRLGEKVSILVDRVLELWNGTSASKQGKNAKNSKSGGNVKVSQPISGQSMMGQGITGQSMFNDGTSINSLPMNDMSTSMPPQQLPNYNNMHRQDTTPLVNAATPGAEGLSMVQEPMAANSVLGGGAFGSW
jgi:hypothetical protein